MRAAVVRVWWEHLLKGQTTQIGQHRAHIAPTLHSLGLGDVTALCARPLAGLRLQPLMQGPTPRLSVESSADSPPPPHHMSSRCSGNDSPTPHSAPGRRLACQQAFQGFLIYHYVYPALHTRHLWSEPQGAWQHIDVGRIQKGGVSARPVTIARRQMGLDRCALLVSIISLAW